MTASEPKYDPSYYADEEERALSTRYMAIAILALEMGVAILSIISFEGFQECCGESFLYDTTRGEEMWEKGIFWTSVAYLGLAVVQIPFVTKGWHVATYNPLLGFALAYFTLYNADKWEAMVMCGLEIAAVVCESYALFQDQSYSLLLLQTTLMYGASGVAIYSLISLSNQGGYCIVDDQLQNIFQESTCAIDCDDINILCSVCDSEVPSCFIKF